MIIFHDGRCTEYSEPGHQERPARIERSVPLLKTGHPDWEWRAPQPATEAALLRAHSSEYVESIRSAAQAFTPLEAPQAFAAAVREALGTRGPT